jgi:RNA recognition motif-containing protein
MFKIYVGNLDYKVKVEQLRELFSVFAPIEDLVIPTDPKTNKAKGFAIVMIRDPELGQAAVKSMQGKRLMGRALVVNEAVKKKKATEAPSKTDLIRNGPFGPRLNRFGDTRAAGARPSRNPRRGGGGTAGRPATSGVTPPPATPLPRPVSDRPRSLTESSGSAPEHASPSVARPPSNSSQTAAASASPAAVPTTPSRPAPVVSSPPPVPTPAVPARPKAQKLAAPKRPSDQADPA